MKNLINQLKKQFAEQIKNYGITEVFVFNGEVYITSNYDLHHSLVENLENAARKLV